MEGYSVTEAASVLGVTTEKVWELLARGILAGAPDRESGMRVFLQPRPAPTSLEPPRAAGGGGGPAEREPERELSPFRELLTEFRNLTERYGQALLALGEARGEVAALRSRVDMLEARIELRLPPGGAAASGWGATTPARPAAIPPPIEGPEPRPVIPAPEPESAAPPPEVAAEAAVRAQPPPPPVPMPEPVAAAQPVAEPKAESEPTPEPSTAPPARSLSEPTTGPAADALTEPEPLPEADAVAAAEPIPQAEPMPGAQATLEAAPQPEPGHEPTVEVGAEPGGVSAETTPIPASEPVEAEAEPGVAAEPAPVPVLEQEPTAEPSVVPEPVAEVVSGEVSVHPEPAVDGEPIVEIAPPPVEEAPVDAPESGDIDQRPSRRRHPAEHFAEALARADDPSVAGLAVGDEAAEAEADLPREAVPAAEMPTVEAAEAEVEGEPVPAEAPPEPEAPPASWEDARYTTALGEPDWFADELEDPTVISDWEERAAASTEVAEPEPEPAAEGAGGAVDAITTIPVGDDNPPVVARDAAAEPESDEPTTPGPGSTPGGLLGRLRDIRERAEAEQPSPIGGHHAAVANEPLPSKPTGEAAWARHDDADDMEVAPAGHGPASSVAPASGSVTETHGVDEALAALETLSSMARAQPEVESARQVAPADEPRHIPAWERRPATPAGRAYRRLRRIFPGSG